MVQDYLILSDKGFSATKNTDQKPPVRANYHGLLRLMGNSKHYRLFSGVHGFTGKTVRLQYRKGTNVLQVGEMLVPDGKVAFRC